MGSDDRPVGACPICGSREEGAWRPFCSKRCSDADLGRWLSGSYALPGEAVDLVEHGDNGEETIVH